MNNRQPVINQIVKAGHVKALSAAFNISTEAVYKWRRVPAERVLGVEKVTGISRHELRPDLYPLEAAE